MNIDVPCHVYALASNRDIEHINRRDQPQQYATIIKITPGREVSADILLLEQHCISTPNVFPVDDDREKLLQP